MADVRPKILELSCGRERERSAGLRPEWTRTSLDLLDVTPAAEGADRDNAAGTTVDPTWDGGSLGAKDVMERAILGPLYLGDHPVFTFVRFGG
jgi:hypothetical protein